MVASGAAPEVAVYAASAVLPVSSPAILGGAVAVQGGLVVEVGSAADLSRRFGTPTAEFPGCVIIPGLVNAHSHLELTHFPSWLLRKGVGYSPRSFVDWVIQVIKVRKSLTPQELAHSVSEGLRISLESGTTSLGEILTDRTLAPLYRSSPLGGRLYFEALGRDPLHCQALLRDLEEAVSSASGSFLPGLSPHSPYTVSADLASDLAKLAERSVARLALHLAEPREEGEFLFDSGGAIAEKLYPFVHWERFLPPPEKTTSAAWADARGLLGPRTTVIHCVHLTPAEGELLKKKGVSVVLCPRSNDRLDVGEAPVALFRKLGLPLALGTDSLASNDSLSMLDEMRFLLDRFPGVFSAGDALRMATSGGAAALGIDAGSLAPGKNADFAVVAASPSATEEETAARVIGEGKVVEVFISGKPRLVAGT